MLQFDLWDRYREACASRSRMFFCCLQHTVDVRCYLGKDEIHFEPLSWNLRIRMLLGCTATQCTRHREGFRIARPCRHGRTAGDFLTTGRMFFYAGMWVDVEITPIMVALLDRWARPKKGGILKVVTLVMLFDNEEAGTSSRHHCEIDFHPLLDDVRM